MSATEISYLVPDQDRRAQCLARRELLRKRLALLDTSDRVLLELHIIQGASYRQLARLAGVSENTVARRIRALIDRLLDSRYLTVFRRRQQFTPDEMAVAYDRYLLGLSYRAIVVKRRLGQRHVRRTIRRLDGWLQRQHTRSRKPSRTA